MDTRRYESGSEIMNSSERLVLYRACLNKPRLLLHMPPSAHDSSIWTDGVLIAYSRELFPCQQACGFFMEVGVDATCALGPYSMLWQVAATGLNDT